MLEFLVVKNAENTANKKTGKEGQELQEKTHLAF